MGYDVIGDIHGYAAKLEALLRKLGYTNRGGDWKPPTERQAVFLGDLIDRGPEQVKTLDIVRRMIDAGNARCIMGNHEFNALGYATRWSDDSTTYLRPHSPKNIAQHAEFLHQVGENSAMHREFLAWFRCLPVTLDLGGIRAVHAWWHDSYVSLIRNQLAEGASMDDAFLVEAHCKGSPEWKAMEGLTKGLEISLPPGHSFIDHSGIRRTEVRTRWWLETPRSYRQAALVGESQEDVPDHPLPPDYEGKPVVGSPVFVGHYWMRGTPRVETPKLACLDWSAAKDGPLVAYRWDGEDILHAGNLVWTGAETESLIVGSARP